MGPVPSWLLLLPGFGLTALMGVAGIVDEIGRRRMRVTTGSLVLTTLELRLEARLQAGPVIRKMSRK